MNVSLPWFASPRVQKLALGILAVVAIVQGVVAVYFRLNDFDVHRWQSEGFGYGEVYADGMDTYPVARVMMNWFLAFIPHHGARAFCYVMSLVALYAVYRMWSNMAQARETVPALVDRAAGLLAVFLLLPYVLRDLDECGLQIFLLFFLSAAGYALFRDRPILTGFWIGTAISYKVAPLLFVPFLMWKRQWRATFYSVGFVAAWALAPAYFIGMDATIDAHQAWLTRIAKVTGAKEAYPSLQELEPPKPQNLSLLAVAGRYLQTFPDDHPLVLDHPWFRQFGNLEPLHAYYVGRGVLLGLVLLLAWRWRRGWHGGELASRLPGEWACVTMLASLLAPQCWKQHLVVVLPAAFLVLRQELANHSWLRWRTGALLLIGVVVVAGRRELIGKDLSILILSYKLDSFACLGMLGLTLLLPSPRKVVASPVPAPLQALAKAA